MHEANWQGLCKVMNCACPMQRRETATPKARQQASRSKADCLCLSTFILAVVHISSLLIYSNTKKPSPGPANWTKEDALDRLLVIFVTVSVVAEISVILRLKVAKPKPCVRLTSIHPPKSNFLFFTFLLKFRRNYYVFSRLNIINN